ncbi:hypothetical protein Syun_001988 [Stephania yunnanensis]|uniref:Uncharacterized protein n=1 Tax=Stephania yunnanensis TaxID=152371 RepID=A0AAP0LFV3_9MAGN
MDVTTAPTQLKRSYSRLRMIKKPTVPLNIVDTPVLIKDDDDKADGRLQPLQSNKEMQKWVAKFFVRAHIPTKSLHYYVTYVASNPSKKRREKPEGNHLGKLFIEMGLPPPSRHEYEEVLRDRVDVIREKNFKKMVYIQSKPEESVEGGEEMSTDDDDCDDSGEIDSEEGSNEE